jgi:hypothetical protein
MHLRRLSNGRVGDVINVTEFLGIQIRLHTIFGRNGKISLLHLLQISSMALLEIDDKITKLWEKWEAPTTE